MTMIRDTVSAAIRKSTAVRKEYFWIPMSAAKEIMIAMIYPMTPYDNAYVPMPSMTLTMAARPSQPSSCWWKREISTNVIMMLIMINSNPPRTIGVHSIPKTAWAVFVQYLYFLRSSFLMIAE